MSPVVLDNTMSVDGFVAAPDDPPGRGLGDHGEVLHYWVFGRPWTYENLEGQERKLGASKGNDKRCSTR